MRMSALIAIMMLSGFGALHAQSGRPVSAFEVHQACRHPAAFPVDSFGGPRANVMPKWRNTYGRGDQDPKLSLLCNVLTLRTPGMNWRQAAKRWANVAQRDSFPRADAIRMYADSAESALYEWIMSQPAQPGSSSDQRRLVLPAISFKPDSAEVTLPDSALRQIAQMIRDHLLRFPTDTIVIRGQADYTGNDSVNKRLAGQRAVNLFNAIKRFDDGTIASHQGRILTAGYIVAKGVIDDVIESVRQGHLRGAFDTPAALAALRSGELAKARESAFWVVSRSAMSDSRLVAPDLPITVSPTMATPSSWSGSLAIAVVDVVGEQAAEQVQMFVIEEVTREVCGRDSADQKSDKIKHYRRLLPSTCALFGGQAGRELYRPTLATLRDAVRQDVQWVMPKLVATSVASLLTGAEEQRRAEALYAVAVTQYLSGIVAGEDALDALAKVPNRLVQILADSTPVDNTDVGRLLRQATPFVGLYRDARATIRGGADGHELRDQVLVLTLRAFVVNAADPQVWPREWGPNRRPDIAQVLQVVPALTDATDRIEAAYTAFQARPAASPSERIRLVSDVVGAGADLFLTVLPEDNSQVERYRALIAPVREMTIAIAGRDYRNALVDGLVLTANIKNPSAECKLGNGLVCPSAQVFSDPEMRLASFAFDLAGADDQDGMTKALQSFINEGGGYRSKRRGNARSFFTVNAYLGVAGAREYPYESAAADSWQAAVSLPVGVEWVHRWGGSWLPSLSAFLQVIDLGSVASARYRRKDEDGGGSPPDPELIDVLSPGVFGIVSLGKTPLSLGFGGSVAPRALRLEDAAADGRISGAVRLSVFLAVDVPLFP